LFLQTAHVREEKKAASAEKHAADLGKSMPTSNLQPFKVFFFIFITLKP